MQPWQIKALELEASGLKHLDGFIHEHAPLFFYWSHLSLAGFAGVGIERRIAPERWKIQRLMSGQSFSSICRDRHHRHRTHSTRFRRRTIRRIAIMMMVIGMTTATQIAA